MQALARTGLRRDGIAVFEDFLRRQTMEMAGRKLPPTGQDAVAQFEMAMEQNDAERDHGPSGAAFHADIESTQCLRERSTLLECVVTHGSVQVLEELLQSGCDPNALTRYGSSPLHLACQYSEQTDSCCMAMLLLQHGAVVNRIDSCYDTPLHVAVRGRGRQELVDILCAHGGDVNVPDGKGSTALLAALENDDQEVVQLLCARGADVNKPDYTSGCTPLLKAVRLKHVGNVQILCSHGASVNAGADGALPISAALESGHLPLLNILCRCVASTPLLAAIGGRHAHLVASLCAQGADANAADDAGCTPLIKAVEIHNLELVHELVAYGADVNKGDKRGRTPLILSARKGASELIKLLLANGSQINGTDLSGCTALMMAAKEGHAEVIGRLCSGGADINQEDVFGRTALIFAAKRGHGLSIQELCSRGADLNSSLSNGSTPLTYAIEHCHTPQEFIRTFSIYGADINYLDNNGYTPLIKALELQSLESVLEVLSRGADTMKADGCGRAPLIVAAEKCVQGVRMLLSYGADINKICTYTGYTPLTYATEKSQQPTEVLAVLCANGADINREEGDGCTPILKAVQTQRLECLPLLMEKGADVDKGNGKSGCTPLIAAAKSGDIEAVKTLLAYGANASKADNLGCTPLLVACEKQDAALIKEILKEKTDVVQTLHAAAERGYVETVKTLAAHCVNVNQPDDAGCTTLVVALFNKRANVISYLKDHGADVNVDLIHAVEGGHSEAVQILLRHGADINMSEKESGRTPLLIAAQNGQENTLKVLLEHGADVNKTDNSGCSPLIAALQQDHASLVPVLCSHGADVNHVVTPQLSSRSRKDRLHAPHTALMIAAKQGEEDAVRELLKNNCDINAQNSRGNTALHLACHSYTFHKGEWSYRRARRRCQNTDVVQILLEQSHCDYNAQNDNGETALHWTISSLASTGYLKNGELELIKVLLKAGCSAATVRSDGDTPLTTILEVSKKGAIRRNLERRPRLLSLFCDCTELLMTAGHVQKTDFCLMSSDTLRNALETRGIRENAKESCNKPASLQKISKFAVRHLTRKPLAEHLPATGLPPFVQKYVLLEIRD